MLRNKNKFFIILVLFFVILLFTKIDFRLKTDITCCSDDFDYFIHAETIAEDFDFDYANQLQGVEKARHNKVKIAPFGFLGSGLLAAPFLLIGNIFDNIFGEISQNHVNFKILFYSFSSYFYFLASLYFLYKSILYLGFNITTSKILLYISGSGVIYYFFERYSMTHVYEVFASSFIIFLSSAFYSTNRNLFAFLIPFSIFIGFEIKWIHYYFLLLPLLIKHLKKSEIKLYKNLYFVFSSLLFLITHFISTKLIYGVYTVNWSYVYNNKEENEFVADVLSNGLTSVAFYITNIKSDVTSDNISKAKSLAENEARSKAFLRLLKRLSVTKKKNIKFNLDIKNLINFIKINEEANSLKRFVGSFDVCFNRKAVVNFFQSNNWPDNYLEYKRVSTDATNECCSDPRSMTVYLAEEANIDLLMRDELKRPDFDWGETYCTLSNDTVKIFKRDFNVVNPSLTFYRKPRNMEILGCVDPYTEVTSLADVEPEFKDDIVEVIIDDAVAIVAGDIDAVNQALRGAQSAEKNN